jgi:hypothetical protein
MTLPKSFKRLLRFFLFTLISAFALSGVAVAHMAQAFGVETEALRCGDGTGVLVPMRALKGPSADKKASESATACAPQLATTA